MAAVLTFQASGSLDLSFPYIYIIFLAAEEKGGSSGRNTDTAAAHTTILRHAHTHTTFFTHPPEALHRRRE
jgi:hypothetical protein